MIMNRFNLSVLAVAAGLLLAATSAHAGDIQPPKINMVSPGGVNLADGVLSFSQTDLSIGSLKLERSYLGGTTPTKALGQFGAKMISNFNIWVQPNSAPPVRPFFPARYKPIVHIGASTSGKFTQAMTAGSPISADSAEAGGAYLVLVNGNYVYTDTQGTVYTFRPDGSGLAFQQNISTIQYQNGRLLTFSYNGSNKLKTVVDSTGYAIVFDYGSNGYVSAACGFNLSQTTVSIGSTCTGAALKTSYAYTSGSPPFLSSFTDVLGNATTYGSPLLSCITPPGYSGCKVSSAIVGGAGMDQVTQQTFADGTTWSYTAGESGGAARDADYVPYDGDNTSTMTNPNNVTSTYVFTGATPYSYTDAAGHTTNYRYTGSKDFETMNGPTTDGTNLAEVDLPEGGIYLESHGGFNLVTQRTMKAKPGSGLADVSETFGYAACPASAPNTPNLVCTQPIWKKDAKNNETDFTYDSTHGGVLTETDPPDANGVRPQTRYSYTLLYPKIWNGSALVNGAPQWKLTRTSSCQTATSANPASCVGTATETVTTFAYNTNDLQLSSKTVAAGDGSVSATESYSYDAYGNLTVVDGPRTDVDDRSYKTYDLMHRPIFEIGVDPDGPNTGNPRVIVKHTYDADGRETLTQTGTGNNTDGSDFVAYSFKRMTYDGMDRVIKTEVGTY
jgi:hypothetical protein